MTIVDNTPNNKTKMKKSSKKHFHIDNDDRVFEDTLAEILIIILIIFTFGFFLATRKSSTNKSLIHNYFKYIDMIMYDPSLDPLS